MLSLNQSYYQIIVCKSKLYDSLIYVMCKHLLKLAWIILCMICTEYTWFSVLEFCFCRTMLSDWLWRTCGMLHNLFLCCGCETNQCYWLIGSACLVVSSGGRHSPSWSFNCSKERSSRKARQNVQDDVRCCLLFWFPYQLWWWPDNWFRTYLWQSGLCEEIWTEIPASPGICCQY